MQPMIDPHSVIIATAFVAIVLILAILVILARSRTLEMKLILIGVFLAIAGAVLGSIPGPSISAGPNVVSIGVGSAPLTRVATILILSGVALSALSRPLTPDRAEGTHVA